MTDDELYRPPEDGSASGRDLVAHEASHVVQSGEGAAGDPSDDASSGDDENPGDQVPDVVESAAELGLGAVIAPFTGGETVSIIGSVASMFEGAVDRLKHLGEHETPPEAGADDAADDAAGAADDAADGRE